MIKTTQFERRIQPVPTDTEPVKDKVNAGDSPHRCIIGVHQSTPHVEAMLRVVADLRSGHQSAKITSPACISKHGRRETEENCLYTNPEADQQIWVLERLEN
jgi:hypothetical protein